MAAICQAISAISIHALLAESDISHTHQHAKNNISIHALLAESDSVTTSFQGGFAISIHALLAESDFACWYIKEMVANISIHALLAESDVPRHGTGACHRDFYPRSPCGERRLLYVI